MTGTVERAKGRWKDILPRLGISITFLRNRHGPCPVCGGRDRFRFDDRNGSGSYYCGQCGPGAGLMLLRKLNNWDYATACRAIDELIGTDFQPQQPMPVKTDADAKKAALVQQLLREAKDRRVVDDYLARRGLSVTSPVLKGHPSCRYYDDEGHLRGQFPAVLAPIAAAVNGAIVGVHRIYQADVDPRKKMLAPHGTIKGGAVRLHECDDELGVAEGFETALAAHELHGVPVWAALTAGGVEAFQPPPGLRVLHVFADNDENFTGQEAAFKLARRLSLAKTKVLVHVPPQPGTDWLDVLNGEQRSGA